MSEIVFMHAADIHLDSPFSGLKELPISMVERLREGTFKAFQNMIDSCIQHKVDFLLLSGDLYDGENRSLRTQSRFKKEMARLNQHNIPVYIIHGNHDHLDGTWVTMEFPGNVHIFNATMEVKTYQKHDGTIVNLYGSSYSIRHVADRLIDSYAIQGDADYHIGLLHGNLEGSSGHSPYAPFSIKDLTEKGMDYWALGHIHKAQVVLTQPLSVYPGNLQGRHRKESGRKGSYLVKLDKMSADYTFVDAADILWEAAHLQIPAGLPFDDILYLCRNKLEELRFRNKGVLLELTLTISSGDEAGVFTPVFIDQLLEILQDGEEEREDFVWIYRMKLVSSVHDSDIDKPATPFINEMLQIADSFDGSSEAVQPLFSHPKTRRYIEQLTKEEFDDLLNDATLLLCQLLK
ncbi:DNA repair exonuclease [Bacillus sp. M6-12]|uniref:metallophosphoesterase family protein n=1 Tax=Bacillus sp. M6-12 TaxID=2054166 RepID=UPI000C777DB8|nr:DNA repair exonuclease [Bacillus sp. M6-12]PLS17529.1 DNA repair exonuclease [Bacillus sp. M6-12]